MHYGRLARASRNSRAISPIIATLLLILIAIASGVILYSYVTGFIGSSTQNPGLSVSTISIDNACVSTISTHCSGSQYSITIRNLGTNTIASASPGAQIYFTDISNSATGSVTCTISASIAPGSSLHCPPSTNNPAFPFTPTLGDTISIKVVMPDGGAAIATTKVIS